MIKKLVLILLAGCALAAGVMVSQYQKADFSLLGGDNMRWQDYQGKWLVVNYFAKWCAPCLEEVPELNQFYQLSKQQNIGLIAISWDKLAQQQLEQIVEQYQMQFPLVHEFYTPPPFERPAQLPVSYIISPEGKVVKTLKGQQTADSLFNYIAELKQ
ncbi:TlpA disulfide reductase family protein [Neptunicella marina]|uniref:TlpA family protein disulfide reductase n=1 Tax=Neptunicella marina TaxID=2125989 RepID=A0A8J6IXU9_9ALTE|nr:TlpA disulfide reductase family protein [Neptunicella marina]MBC3767351.1 TlpA family protein disulfide reductase [Neptunicella marina]